MICPAVWDDFLPEAGFSPFRANSYGEPIKGRKTMPGRSRRALLAAALIAGSLVAIPGGATQETRLPCDALDPAHCLLPFPNDRFTRTDDTTDTGRRIDFLPVEMPRSIAGKPIDPVEWNRNDGFSPGSMVLTFVPGLDLHRTWGTHDLEAPVGGPNDPRDHIADISRFQAADAPILLINEQTGERWPFWSELDMNAQTKADERLLILRPAVNFKEGHRYLVALRNMRDAQGDVIEAGAHFAAYRDGPSLLDLTVEEARRDDLDEIMTKIAAAEATRGNAFDRSDLYLSWGFTVASGRNLSERVLHIRDESLANLGDTDLVDGVVAGSPPQFEITAIADKSSDTRKLKQIDGTITVPNYLDRPPLPTTPSISNPVQSVPGQAIPGGRFLYGLDGLPMQNPADPWIKVPFVCTIPKATAENPAHPMLYGHGLLGSRNESTGGSSDRMRERGFMPCAVNWMGFAEYDIAGALVTLLDPSNMASMADRSQQGFLNWILLARAIAHPNGFASNAAFQDTSGSPLIRTNELVYDGNSQGAIMGGALTAVSVDFTRANLGVPGMNYSTLLNRSVDWEGPLFNPSSPDVPSYSSFLYTMFPDKKEQQVVMGLIQMLWDRAESNGYAQHMTDDPYPNTPAKQVMLHVAYGDFQVANVSAEVEARTIGARVMDTALLSLPDRHWEIDPYFGLEPMPRDELGNIAPWRGSALVYWDSGNLPPPNANVPPRLDGGDPHEDPRRDHRSGDQRARFFLTGEIIDVMNGGAYLLCRPGFENQIPRVPILFEYDWCTA